MLDDAVARVGRELVRRWMSAGELQVLCGRGVDVERVLNLVEGKARAAGLGYRLLKTQVKPKHCRKTRTVWRLVQDTFQGGPRAIRRPVQRELFDVSAVAVGQSGPAFPRRRPVGPRPVRKSAAALRDLVKSNR